MQKSVPVRTRRCLEKRGLESEGLVSSAGSFEKMLKFSWDAGLGVSGIVIGILGGSRKDHRVVR